MGCRLTNSTEGGEGILNPSAETRAKISYAARHRSPATLAKLSTSLTGKTHSLETRAKLSAAHKGKRLPPLTPTARAKISQALTGNQHFLGHRHSVETRAKQAAAKIGNASRRGMLHSDETKRKMSAKARGEGSSSAKLTWEQVREIRHRHAAGGITQTALAREYGISSGTLCVMLQGKTWIEDDF